VKVPFLDLNPMHRPLQAELESRFAQVLARNHFIMGQELEAFESKFSDFTGSRYTLGVGNGLDALIISLRALGIGAGDRVLVPAHTFVATALAVTAVHATPVFVDCEPETGLISKEQLTTASRGDEKAVIPVHLYGSRVRWTKS
jgi:dTDP-4-amino-4,6-dideoxygalactose transaminase